MTKFQTSLLALGLVGIGIGVYWVYVGLGDREPEVKRNPLLCPSCGRPLTQKDAPCFWCQKKKNREQMEEALRQGSATKEPSKTSGGIVKVIVAASIPGVLLVFVYWPQIRRLFRLKAQDQAVEYYSFHCPHCRRKLRYNASKAGMPGQCPSCKEYCTFPEPETEPAD